MRGNARNCGLQMHGNVQDRVLRGNVSCMDAAKPWIESVGRKWEAHTGSEAQEPLKRVGPRFHAFMGPVFILDRHIKG